MIYVILASLGFLGSRWYRQQLLLDLLKVRLTWELRRLYVARIQIFDADREIGISGEIKGNLYLLLSFLSSSIHLKCHRAEGKVLRAFLALALQYMDRHGSLVVG